MARPPTPTPTFKDENRALQEMVREFKVLQAHNKRFNDGDDLSTVLMFAEGALICMICEHFIRMVVEKNYPGETNEKTTLRGLLDFAMTTERNLFQLPMFETSEKGKEAVCAHRNAILHGNFAQAAKQSGCASVAEYFKTLYTQEMMAMTDVVNSLLGQIDVATGEPNHRK